MSKSPSLVRALLSGLAMLATAVLPTLAQANVRHTTTGSACQWGDPSARAGRTAEGAYFHSYYYGGKPWHGDSMMHILSCPVLRMLPLSTEGMSDLELRFDNILDGNASVTCTAFAKRTDGSVMVSAQRTVTWTALPNEGHPDGQAYIKVMDFGSALNASVSKGTFHVECDMPSWISLDTIYGSEEDGINNN